MHLLYFVSSWNETDPPYTGGKKFDIIVTSIFGMPLFDMHVMNMHATNEVGLFFWIRLLVFFTWISELLTFIQLEMLVTLKYQLCIAIIIGNRMCSSKCCCIPCVLCNRWNTPVMLPINSSGYKYASITPPTFHISGKKQRKITTMVAEIWSHTMWPCDPHNFVWKY